MQTTFAVICIVAVTLYFELQINRNTHINSSVLSRFEALDYCCWNHFERIFILARIAYILYAYENTAINGLHGKISVNWAKKMQ